MHSRRLVAAAAVLFVSSLALQCSRSTAAPPPVAARGEAPEAIVSIRELMQHIMDPLADNIFDAVGTDVTEKGVVDHKPTTDDDWAKVMQGAVLLAEGTNLLKMHPRRAAPADYTFDPKERGPGAPELAPEEIQKKIDANPAMFDQHANDLRNEAIKVIDIVKARDADKLFEAGSNIDKACENCHLEYWYPGDKQAVLEDAAKRATIVPKGEEKK
jgi:hypothetical protein